MKNIRKILLLNRYYFSGFVLFFVAALFLLLFTSKADSFVILNSYHNQLLDIFFISYTNLGDGIFTIIIFLLLLASRRLEFAWQMMAAFVISGLIAQLLKNIVFSPRPREFFTSVQHIHIIEGITHVGTSSFPSGHTASIFALVTSFALFSKNKKTALLYLTLAILVGYSRIYLAQHFLIDVLAGSFIGVLVALCVHSFFTTQINGRLIKKRNKRQVAAVN